MRRLAVPENRQAQRVPHAPIQKPPACCGHDQRVYVSKDSGRLASHCVK